MVAEAEVGQRIVLCPPQHGADAAHVLPRHAVAAAIGAVEVQALGIKTCHDAGRGVLVQVVLRDAGDGGVIGGAGARMRLP